MSLGGTERAQQSIMSLLRNFVNEMKTTWEKYIGSLAQARNTCDNQPLRYCSNVLVIGHLPFFPSEIYLSNPLNVLDNQKDHFVSFLQALPESHVYAKAHLKEQ